MEYSTSTIHRRLWALKSFLRFIYKMELISKNFDIFVDIPKRYQPLPCFLSIEEVKKLLNQPNNKCFIGARDKLIIELLYGTGIRVSELCNLKYKDIYEDYISITSKGNKPKLIPLNGYIMDSLKIYLNHLTDINPDDYVFISQKSGKIDRVSVYIRLKLYAKRAKIQRKVYPHILRHSFATHMLENGADIKVIQEALGHEHISSTTRYLHVTLSHLKKSINRFHPRSEIAAQ